MLLWRSGRLSRAFLVSGDALWCDVVVVIVFSNVRYPTKSSLILSPSQTQGKQEGQWEESVCSSNKYHVLYTSSRVVHNLMTID
jgi:hypothetical protein